MSLHHNEVRHRDDGMFEVVSGEIVAGPFPTIIFAMQIAAGAKPTPVPRGRFRRCRIVREAPHNAA